MYVLSFSENCLPVGRDPARAQVASQVQNNPTSRPFCSHVCGRKAVALSPR